MRYEELIERLDFFDEDESVYADVLELSVCFAEHAAETAHKLSLLKSANSFIDNDRSNVWDVSSHTIANAIISGSSDVMNSSKFLDRLQVNPISLRMLDKEIINCERVIALAQLTMGALEHLRKNSADLGSDVKLTKDFTAAETLSQEVLGNVLGFNLVREGRADFMADSQALSNTASMQIIQIAEREGFDYRKVAPAIRCG